MQRVLSERTNDIITELNSGAGVGRLDEIDDIMKVNAVTSLVFGNENSMNIAADQFIWHTAEEMVDVIAQNDMVDSESMDDIDRLRSLLKKLSQIRSRAPYENKDEEDCSVRLLIFKEVLYSSWMKNLHAEKFT